MVLQYTGPTGSYFDLDFVSDPLSAVGNPSDTIPRSSGRVTSARRRAIGSTRTRLRIRILRSPMIPRGQIIWTI